MSVKIPGSFLLRIPTVKSYYILFRTVRAVMQLAIDQPYDIAIVPRGGVDPSFSAHAVWLLNVPASFGYSHLVEPDEIDHNNGDCLLTTVIEQVSERHEAMRALTLLEAAGLVPDATRRWTEDRPIRAIQEIAARHNPLRLLSGLGIEPGTEFIVISPGAGMKKKMWPQEKFREACRRLVSRSNYPVLLTGTEREFDLCAGISEGLGPRVHNLAGRLSLTELIGLFSRASIFVGNDSGSGHISGALGRPTISLHVQPKTGEASHISSPEHYRPAGPQVIVVQPDDFLAPCEGRCESEEVHCLGQVTVDQVWAAMLPLLEQSAARVPAVHAAAEVA